MLKFSSWTERIAALALLAVSSASAFGATVFETTELLAAPTATTPVRPALTFVVPASGDYTLTLTDFRTPAPLTTLRAIVTRDLQVVSTLALVQPGNGTMPIPASITFSAAPGTYRLHVLGVVASNETSGGYGVKVAPAAGGASLLDTVELLAANAQTAANTTSHLAEFQIADAGNYILSVTDHAFPVSLASAPQVLLLQQQTAGDPIPVLNAPGTFAATPGTYTLIAVATANAASQAGLFSAEVRGGPSNIRVYETTRGIGRMPAPINVTLPAGQVALALADVAFPSALASVNAMVMQNGAALGKLTAAGTTSINAVAGTAQLYAVATATANEGVGAFSVKLSQGSSVAFESVRIADNSPDATTPAIYSVTSSSALAAGSYRVALKDVGFSTAFGTLRAAITQGATLLDRIEGSADKTLDLQSAPLRILIATRPAASGSNGLFAVQVTSQPAGTSILETTQGVGGLFHSVPISISAAGRYDITLADLQFPNNLGSAALAVTQGTSLVGQVFGTGVLRQQLSAGTYVLNFLGVPSTVSAHGAYGLRVADSPAIPVVTLSSSTSNVVSGGTTTLTWSATNATACTAANGWSGAKATSGSESVGPLTALTTYELSCTGPGGSTTSKVDVGVSSPSSGGKGGGGGGALGFPVLILLAACAIGRARR